jgi:hypothetical protein
MSGNDPKGLSAPLQRAVNSGECNVLPPIIWSSSFAIATPNGSCLWEKGRSGHRPLGLGA